MILIGRGQWRSPICDILNDFPFKGLGNLPEFLNLTPHCIMQRQVKSYLASCSEDTLPGIFTSTPRCMLQRQDLTPRWICSGKIWLPAAFAAVRSDSPLQNATGSHISPLQNAAGRFLKNHRLDSQLHHAAASFDSPLQYAVGRFYSLLHNAAHRFDSPLQYAASSQTSIQITPRSKVGTFDEKKRRWKISHY